MRGVWVIALESTPKEDLQVYFGGNDAQDLLAKASSTIFTFDLEKMRFSRKTSGKETIRRIREIAQDQVEPEKLVLWLEQVKFPDYIVALPDGRLRYGSAWATPWEFILRRP